MAVLVTRPHPDDESTASALRARGFEVLLAPMLRFEPVGAGTRVDVTIELSLPGPARLVGGTFARWYGGSWERGLARLKAMMEAGEL